MNVNSIINTAYSSYTPAGKKDKDSESFADFLEACSAEKEASNQVTEYAVNSEDIQAIAAATGHKVKISFDPSYTLTDEEAEYFREKYGENYDEEALKDLFYELAENEIISDSDAMNASGIGRFFKVEVIGYVPPGASAVELWSKGLVQLKIGEEHYIRDIAYDNAYEKFDRNYTDDVVTWEDFIQKRLDFVEYLQSCDVLYDPDGNPYNREFDFSDWQSSLERTKEIIKQIFG